MSHEQAPSPTPIPTQQMGDYMQREAETVARVQAAEATASQRMPIQEELVNTDGVAPIDLYREDPYSDIQDLVDVGGNDQHKTFHRPNGEFMSRYELEQIQSHQDLIRSTVDKREEPVVGPRLPRIAGAAAIEGFFDPTNNPETAELRNRANFLQNTVENTLRAMKNNGANHISLENTLRQYSQEFTDIISGTEFKREENFVLKEGGLKLLEKGLIAGKVPTLEGLDNLQTLVARQQIEKVVRDSKGNPHPGFNANPRYLRDGKPAFGPYSSPEEDTVEHVIALTDPKTWKLSQEDKDYLQRVLQTNDLTKYKTAPGPTGEIHFWNKPPFDVYLKRDTKNMKQRMKGGLTQEQQRVADMSDPAKLEQISHSNTIFDWWNRSVNRTHVSTSTNDKKNKNTTILNDVKSYAQARLDLNEQI